MVAGRLAVPAGAPGISVAMLFPQRQKVERHRHPQRINRLEDLIEEADVDGGEVYCSLILRA